MCFYEVVGKLASQVAEFVIWVVGAVHCFGSASTNYGSLIATLVAAVVLFVIKEYSNRASNYSGVFFTRSTVVSTDYNPYRDMRTFHTLVIFSDGYVISGTSEKTGDISMKGACEYVGKQKIRGVVTGRIERNYIRGSVIHMHIVEQGFDREITTYMSVRVRKYSFFIGPLKGEFYTTASNAKGDVQCGREKFSEHPSGCLRPPSIWRFL